MLARFSASAPLESSYRPPSTARCVPDGIVRILLHGADGWTDDPAPLVVVDPTPASP